MDASSHPSGLGQLVFECPAGVVWILLLVLCGSLSSSLPTYGERRERGGHFIVVARKPKDILGTGQKNGDPFWLRSLGLEAQGGSFSGSRTLTLQKPR